MPEKKINQNSNGTVKITTRDIYERVVSLETRLTDVSNTVGLQSVSNGQKIESLTQSLDSLIEETKKLNRNHETRINKIEDVFIRYDPDKSVQRWEQWGKEWEEFKVKKALIFSVIAGAGGLGGVVGMYILNYFFPSR